MKFLPSIAIASSFFLAVGIQAEESPKQDADGLITGILLDAQGKPAADVSISIVNEATGPGWIGVLPQPVAKTDEEGKFQIGQLKAGRYSVFVFGSKNYLEFRARPAQGLVVEEGVASKVELKYEPMVEFAVSLDGVTKWPAMKGAYWIRSPDKPLVSGVPTGRAMPKFNQASISIKTLPGDVFLSMDPSFSEEAEVFKYEVSPDGKVTGPKTIPHARFAPVHFAVSGEDGMKIDGAKIKIELASIAETRGRKVDNFQTFDDRKDRNIIHVTRGIAVKAHITADGYAPFESESFTVLPDLKPLNVVLKTAKPAEVTPEKE